MELANRTKRVHKSQLHHLDLSSKGNHPEPDNKEEVCANLEVLSTRT